MVRDQMVLFIPVYGDHMWIPQENLCWTLCLHRILLSTWHDLVIIDHKQTYTTSHCLTKELNSAEAWISIDNGPGKPTCIQHFRADKCIKKRCKYSHEQSLALVPGVIINEDSSSEASDLHLYRTTDLEAIPKTQYNDLYMLIYDNVCVYDCCNAVCWETFSGILKERRMVVMKTAASTKGTTSLSVISEDCNEDFIAHIDRLVSATEDIKLSGDPMIESMPPIKSTYRSPNSYSNWLYTQLCLSLQLHWSAGVGSDNVHGCPDRSVYGRLCLQIFEMYVFMLIRSIYSILLKFLQCGCDC